MKHINTNNQNLQDLENFLEDKPEKFENDIISEEEEAEKIVIDSSFSHFFYKECTWTILAGYSIFLIISSLLVWICIFPYPKFNDDLLKKIPCTDFDCIIGYEENVCVIKLSNLTFPICLYDKCNEEKIVRKCNFNNNDKCPVIECKGDDDKAARENLSAIFFIIYFVYFGIFIIIIIALKIDYIRSIHDTKKFLKQFYLKSK